MEKSKLRKFREHYFPEKTISESRSIMGKKFGITKSRIKSWEIGQRPIQAWFKKVAEDFDKDNILEKKDVKSK